MEAKVDPWDELIFSSLGPEPRPASELEEATQNSRATPQTSHSYALRSKGDIPEEDWVRPTFSRIRIPKRINL